MPPVTHQNALTPTEYGVGARFTLSVYDSAYVDIILGALATADASAVTVDTTDISTFVGGAENDVLRYLRDVIAAASSGGAHVSAAILLSRGCPGELQCELRAGVDAIGAEPVQLAATGIRARAHWSLYPLLDGGADGDHMTAIYDAIEHAKEIGVYAGSDHYATRLDGDLADVLTTVANAWIAVGRTVQHVTTHVTISINSPTLAAS
ncbi:YkoF family thiamine/hydroxymethylpyrimidine-binding protein [Microbacterium sp. NPDC055357]